MLKNILNLNGLTVLSKDQQKNINGGGLGFENPHPGGGGNDGDSCKATCKDGSLVSVSGCSDAALACGSSGGSSSCKCDYPGPFDPPGFGFTKR